jgi:bacterioferritin (cytochrome b1)
MYFHFYCDDLGYDLLAGLFRRTAIEEMLHIERLAERILFLKGEVEMVASQEVRKIHAVGEMLVTGRKMEEASVRSYNLWANECAANADSASKKVFEDLQNEQCHWTGKFEDDRGKNAIAWAKKKYKVKIYKLTAEEYKAINSKAHTMIDSYLAKTKKAGLPGKKFLDDLYALKAKYEKKYGK